MSSSDKTCCPTDKGVSKTQHTPTGAEFYITGPIGAKGGILLVGDIFGPLPNSKCCADYFAEKGYLVVMPDYFGEKAWDQTNWPPNFESQEWQEFYAVITDMELHTTLTRRGVEILRKLGCTKVATLGTCWGAILALRMGAEGLVDAVSTAHPSFLTAEVVDGAKNVPVMILPSKDESKLEEVEAATNRNPNEHVFKTYDKLPHGFFGNRYDWDNWDEEQHKQMEDALKTSLAFYEKTLA